MIRVKVFPTYGCDRSALDDKSWAEILRTAPFQMS